VSKASHNTIRPSVDGGPRNAKYFAIGHLHAIRYGRPYTRGTSGTGGVIKQTKLDKGGSKKPVFGRTSFMDDPKRKLTTVTCCGNNIQTIYFDEDLLLAEFSQL